MIAQWGVGPCAGPSIGALADVEGAYFLRRPHVAALESARGDDAMPEALLPFEVTALDVTVEEGVKIKWQGREIDSGPLAITLGEPGSHGVIDYENGKVNVEFRVRVVFKELAEILSDMGADPSITAPVHAVIRSQGAVIGDDHSLRLAGKGQLGEHRLFDPEETKIEVLAPSS